LRWLRILLAAGLLGGCVHVAQEPLLPLPERPKIRFFLCDTDKVCLSQADADLLAKFLDQLNAFEAGRQRLTE